ncbi:hypothetical protein [Robertmurraya andreesenii]|uniref:Transcription initiation factor IIE alpha subunit n=1 Tax=Anoxybacillus andreesenii TaxID=1325932 RepID=A0ABT9UYF0_9BACL|nr:hypothetical protein [Robertmurraya andreesenii]MDQ0153721.1 transcription initiation factor IIE alpha subunit [Robertmurraya andreesenii]
MGICPICNGFHEEQKNCRLCGEAMEDSGRVMDFYDDYSPYMPIDQMKLEDGYPEDYKNEQCPHLFKCPTCGFDTIIFIHE